MAGILLLSLLGVGLTLSLVDLFSDNGSDGDSGDTGDDPPVDDETPDPDLDPDPDPDPGPDPDTGATVTEDNGVVTVELGEDETGNLLMMNFIDVETGPDVPTFNHEARLYLMPEGAEMPTGTNAYFPGSGLSEYDEIEDLEDLLGLELLASWDLGSMQPIELGSSVLVGAVEDAPSIQSDDPISYFDVHEGYDFGNLHTIVATTPPTETDAASVSLHHEIDGELTGVQVTEGTLYEATDANDRIETFEAADMTIAGGEGNDIIHLAAGTAYGGAGSDFLSEWHDVGAASSLHGGDGNDIITLNSQGSEGYGGDGNDILRSFAENTVFGGHGDDRLTLSGGGTGYGGTGDDTITHVGDDGGRIYGGAGADVINLTGQGARMVTNGGTGADVITVTGDDQIVYGGADYLGANDAADIMIATRESGPDVIFTGGNGDTFEIGMGQEARVGQFNDSQDFTVNVYPEHLEGGEARGPAVLQLVAERGSTLGDFSDMSGITINLPPEVEGELQFEQTTGARLYDDLWVYNDLVDEEGRVLVRIVTGTAHGPTDAQLDTLTINRDVVYD